MTRVALSDFDKLAAEGRASVSEDGPLALFCYAPKVQYDRDWCPLTRLARGIIFDRRTGECVARPFPKFFNLGETPETEPEVLPADGFRVEEKLDGSLGIIFHHDGRWRVSTKGSLTSEQAMYATAELLPRYDLNVVGRTVTLCAEIIYPENRIVIDYGDRREMVLLSGFATDTGFEFNRETSEAVALRSGMPIVGEVAHRNLLDLPFDDDAEGYVARFSDGLRVKVKSPRYVKIHRLLEFRSPRRILEMIEAGEYDEIRTQIPDDLAADFDDIYASLRLSLRQVKEEAAALFDAHRALADKSRKDFALAVKNAATPRTLPLLFAMLDGKDVDALAIKAVRNEL